MIGYRFYLFGTLHAALFILINKRRTTKSSKNQLFDINMTFCAFSCFLLKNAFFLRRGQELQLILQNALFLSIRCKAYIFGKLFVSLLAPMLDTIFHFAYLFP